ncbi:hypothetical protein MY04_4184 [Flammeovirga sp. MY04]|uniref:hypothetical protein n=1 Tax=Flammeovirga sp. MY04 TaxID=1191459 RepID=UPI0013052830|nr:hypothetical protein [Flammeovirga sp. MY04]ANQ51526.2 hypothetical protein MY04_4184 [Flammeovirga sp. MY04]
MKKLTKKLSLVGMLLLCPIFLFGKNKLPLNETLHYTFRMIEYKSDNTLSILELETEVEFLNQDGDLQIELMEVRTHQEDEVYTQSLDMSFNEKSYFVRGLEYLKGKKLQVNKDLRLIGIKGIDQGSKKYEELEYNTKEFFEKLQLQNPLVSLHPVLFNAESIHPNFKKVLKSKKEVTVPFEEMFDLQDEEVTLVGEFTYQPLEKKKKQLIYDANFKELEVSVTAKTEIAPEGMYNFYQTATYSDKKDGFLILEVERHDGNGNNDRYHMLHRLIYDLINLENVTLLNEKFGGETLKEDDKFEDIKDYTDEEINDYLDKMVNNLSFYRDEVFNNSIEILYEGYRFEYPLVSTTFNLKTDIGVALSRNREVSAELTPLQALGVFFPENLFDNTHQQKVKKVTLDAEFNVPYSSKLKVYKKGKTQAESLQFIEQGVQKIILPLENVNSYDAGTEFFDADGNEIYPSVYFGIHGAQTSSEIIRRYVKDPSLSNQLTVEYHHPELHTVKMYFYDKYRTYKRENIEAVAK